MSFWQLIDSRARRLGLIDIKLAQLAAFLFALAIAKLVPDILGASWWWYAGLSVLVALHPMVVVLRRGPSSGAASS